jgi:hypothetical protein
MREDAPVRKVYWPVRVIPVNTGYFLGQETRHGTGDVPSTTTAGTEKSRRDLTGTAARQPDRWACRRKVVIDTDIHRWY